LLAPNAEEWKACENTLKEWTRSLLKECHDKELEGSTLSTAHTMGDLIGRITLGRIYNEGDDTKTQGLYWTHTVKCFLQNEENKDMPFRSIKDKRNSEWRCAIRHCSKYLEDEIAKANRKPELIVGVGTTVAGAKLRETRFSSVLCEVYHPGAPMKKDRKKDKLRSLCKRVEKLRLKRYLPGCSKV
jgi:hypothetical protein